MTGTRGDRRRPVAVRPERPLSASRRSIGALRLLFAGSLSLSLGAGAALPGEPAAPPPERAGPGARPEDGADERLPARPEALPPERADAGPDRGPGAAQPTPVRAGPVFTPGGGWSRAEIGLLVGSQRVNEDLGMSRNIFQTVSASAQNVGFGEHYGARGALFLNRYLGAEAAFTRTTTSFEFSISDEEAGVNILGESLSRRSTEFAGALVGQFPLAAMTPYAAVGYGAGNASVDGSEDFRSRAVILGAGVKVPFPQLPFLLTFDFRFFRYLEANETLLLAEGPASPPSAAVITVGFMFRLGPSSF